MFSPAQVEDASRGDTPSGPEALLGRILICCPHTLAAVIIGSGNLSKTVTKLTDKI